MNETCRINSDLTPPVADDSDHEDTQDENQNHLATDVSVEDEEIEADYGDSFQSLPSSTPISASSKSNFSATSPSTDPLVLCARDIAASASAATSIYSSSLSRQAANPSSSLQIAAAHTHDTASCVSQSDAAL